MLELKQDELRIYYQGKPNYEMEDELKPILGKYGYHMWASGFDLEDKIRDLAFDKEKHGVDEED